MSSNPVIMGCTFPWWPWSKGLCWVSVRAGDRARRWSLSNQDHQHHFCRPCLEPTMTVYQLYYEQNEFPRQTLALECAIGYYWRVRTGGASIEGSQHAGGALAMVVVARCFARQWHTILSSQTLLFIKGLWRTIVNWILSSRTERNWTELNGT